MKNLKFTVFALLLSYTLINPYISRANKPWWKIAIADGLGAAEGGLQGAEFGPWGAGIGAVIGGAGASILYADRVGNFPPDVGNSTIPEDYNKAMKATAYGVQVGVLHNKIVGDYYTYRKNSKNFVSLNDYFSFLTKNRKKYFSSYMKQYNISDKQIIKLINHIQKHNSINVILKLNTKNDFKNFILSKTQKNDTKERVEIEKFFNAIDNEKSLKSYFNNMNNGKSNIKGYIKVFVVVFVASNFGFIYH